jgi:signal transduction histidine kinase
MVIRRLMVLNQAMTFPARATLPRLLPFDSISLFLYGVVALGFVYVQAFVVTQTPPYLPWRSGLLGLFLLLMWCIDRWESQTYDGQTPPGVVQRLLAARVFLITSAALVDGFHLGMGLLALVPLRAFYFLDWRSATNWTLLAFVGLGILISLIKPYWYTSGTYVYTVALALLALGLAVYMALMVRREQDARTRSERLLGELELSHRQLSAYAERVADLATLEERNRLAREIHDSLGHYLTAINIQLEKSLVFNDKKPAEALQATRDAKRLADEALEDVRRSVGTLRNAQNLFKLQPALERLVQTVREGSNLEISLRLDGPEQGYPHQSLLTLFRAAQEGLTNVQRHAGATAVQLKVELGQDAARLELHDNGRGFDPEWNKDTSYGLLGLRERLELVGGQLQVQSLHNQGTRLDIRIPRQYVLAGQA